MTPLPGARLGRYEITGAIGASGMDRESVSRQGSTAAGALLTMKCSMLVASDRSM